MNVVGHLISGALTTGASLAVFTLGFALIYRVTNQLHFAYAAVWTVSSYVAAVALDAGFGTSGGLAVALVTSIMLGLVCYEFYTRMESHNTVILSSFGLYLALLGVQLYLWGPSQLGVDPARALTSVIDVPLGSSTMVMPIVTIAYAGAAFLLVICLSVLLGVSRLGAKWRALSDNRQLAESLGMQASRLERSAYVVGSSISAVSATLYTAAYGADVHTGTTLFFESFVVTFLAGPVVLGTVIIAALFGGLVATAQLLVGTQFVSLLTFSALLGLLLLRPEGLYNREVLLVSADRLVPLRRLSFADHNKDAEIDRQGR